MDLHRELSAQESKMSERNLRKCSKSLAPREMQIERILRAFLIPESLTKIKNSINDNLCWRGLWVKGTLLLYWRECTNRGCWLGNATADVPDSGLPCHNILSQACSHRVLCLRPPLLILSPHTCFCGSPWLRLAPSEDSPVYLFWQRLLAQASCKVLILNYMLFNAFD